MSGIKSASIYFGILFCFLFNSSLRSELVHGDTDENADTSFTFPVLLHATDLNGSFYLGAHPDPLVAVDTNEYALSKLYRNGTKFIPLALQKAIVNGVDMTNPFYNNRVQMLALAGSSPVVVLNNDDKTIYQFCGKKVPVDDNKTRSDLEKEQYAIILSATNINDATFAVETSGIVGIGAVENSIFAALKPGAGGDFGAVGSGIALLTRGQKKQTIDGREKVVDVLTQLSTTAFDISSDFIKITNDASEFKFSEFYWDKTFKCFYVALNDATSSVGGGVRSIVIGKIVSDGNGSFTIVFYPIVSDLVFGVGDNEIIGTGVGSKKVSAHKVSTMHTTTRLVYLIVLGGNDEQVDSSRNVFALPLVNDFSNSGALGTLADINEDPEDKFITYPKGETSFAGRILKTQASENADVLKVDSVEAKVGGGQLPNKVVDMFVQGDSVFVVTESDYDLGQTKRRVLYSQAIFNEKGKIVSWSAWCPVHSSEKKIFGVSADKKTGDLVTIESDDDDQKKIFSVRRTNWSFGINDGLGNLSSILKQAFTRVEGGIQGLFDFSEIYPGLEDVSVMVVTGLRKIVLSETGRENPLVINKGNDFSDNSISFDGGTITQDLGGATRVVTISGGILDDIGPIESAEIAYENENKTTRIFVGATGGLAALTNANGSGVVGSIKAGFEGLIDGMSFKKIGNYKFVRKLLSDKDFLYVLTDTKLDRINLIGNNFDTVTLATISDLGLTTHGKFLDFIVSGKLCVIATGSNIFRTGNGKNISTASSSSDVGWTKIVLPDNSGPASRFIWTTWDGLPQSLSTGEGGNLQVLGSYIGKNRAKLNRFYISNLSGSDIDDNTLRPFNDFYVSTSSDGDPVFSYFLNYGTFKKRISDDGAFRFTVKERDLLEDPLFEILNPQLWFGSGALLHLGKSIGVDTSGISDVLELKRSYGSGNLLLASDSELLVNE